MKGSRVAKRYAQALFETAVEKKQLDVVEVDLNRLKRDYDQSDAFRNLVESPVIADDVKQKAFTKAYKDQLQPLTFNFVSLLIGKNRVEALNAVMSEFSELLDAHRGILRGEVSSVVPFSEKQLAALKQKLDKMTGKDVQLSTRTDTSLLGGFVVRLNDLVYDTSLSNKLKKLKQNLAEV